MEVSAVGDMNRLIVLGSEFSALIDKGEGAKPNIIEKLRPAISTYSYFLETATIDDLTIWNGFNHIWISRIDSKKKKESNQVKMNILKYIDLHNYQGKALNQDKATSTRISASKLDSGNPKVYVIRAFEGVGNSYLLKLELDPENLSILNAKQFELAGKVSPNKEFLTFSKDGELRFNQVKVLSSKKPGSRPSKNQNFMINLLKIHLNDQKNANSKSDKTQPLKKIQLKLLDSLFSRIVNSNLHQNGFVCFADQSKGSAKQNEGVLTHFDYELNVKNICSLRTSYRISKVTFLGGSRVTIHLAGAKLAKNSDTRRFHVVGLDMNTKEVKRLVDYKDESQDEWTAQVCGEGSSYVYRLNSGYAERCDWPR